MRVVVQVDNNPDEGVPDTATVAMDDCSILLTVQELVLGSNNFKEATILLDSSSASVLASCLLAAAKEAESCLN